MRITKGTKTSHHGPNDKGNKRAIKDVQKKTLERTDNNLKFEYLKKELRVIVYHDGTVKK